MPSETGMRPTIKYANGDSTMEKRDEEKEEYQFMKEVIKERPISKHRLAVYGGLVAGGAVVFGLIAALVFALVHPAFQDYFEGKEDPPKVDIAQEEDPVSAEEQATAEEAVQSENDSQTEETQQPGVSEGITLDEYEQLYEDILEVAQEPKRAIVSIIGINSNVDWFNEAYDSPTGQVSGFILADNGEELFLLTEYRIVENVERILVTFCDGSTANARFQKTDPNTGLTILKVPLSEISQETKDVIMTAPLGTSYSVKQGQPVIAIGSPMGYSDSVAYGVVTSVTNRISTIDNQYNLVTTDILGSAEGSGILLDLDGEVIGIIAQSYSNEGSKNIVTALAISQIKGLLEDLSNNEELVYVGIKGQDVTMSISDKTGIPQGVYVETVVQDSPAMQAGIQSGDVIVGVGDQNVKTLKAYYEAISAHHAGSSIKLKIMRMGTEGYIEKEFKVTLGAL